MVKSFDGYNCTHMHTYTHCYSIVSMYSPFLGFVVFSCPCHAVSNVLCSCACFIGHKKSYDNNFHLILKWISIEDYE